MSIACCVMFWEVVGTGEGRTACIGGSAESCEICLKKGWNLVGFCSPQSFPVSDALDSIASKIEGVWSYQDGVWLFYSPLSPGFSNLYLMNPGMGYWIRVTDNCTWRLPLTPSSYGYEIVRTYPHDPKAFTQGLVFHDGFFYESTGMYGQSTLRKVEPVTGTVLRSLSLPDELFGEGLTLYGNRLIQLTWTSGIGFVYDRTSFSLSGNFTYKTEGWGITHDGKHLIVSDGTSTLYFWDPETFEEIRRIEVTDQGVKVEKLNELEYIRGEVYANVWQTNRIARISPETGHVVAWINLEGLLSGEEPSHPVDVLNGIAYDPIQSRLFLTGKYWPKLFEIKLVKK